MGFEAIYSGTCTILSTENVQLNEDNITVYPNPANTIVNVKINAIIDSFDYEVFNILGQSVIPVNKALSNEIQINVSGLTKGIYFIKVSNGKEESKIKFSVEK
jgi:Secretion system C-terminal sorting domain